MIVDVLIPVLNRPANVEPLLESLGLSVDGSDAEVQAWFIVGEDDREELEEIRRVEADRIVVPWERMSGDYARKINLGAKVSVADFVFLGADDLRFHPGWLEACLRLHDATGALVIGTNDLGNPLVRMGRHATHSLVHRSYLEQGTIDERGKLLHEGYDHNAVDVEFVETAIWRRTFAFSAEAHVEHMHPTWHKGELDETYRVGQSRYMHDIALLRQRGKLWQHDEVMKMMRRSRRQVVGPGARQISRGR